MSKLVEQLKSLKQQKIESSKPAQRRKDFFTEHLAKTYFPVSTGLKKSNFFLIVILIILVLAGLFLINKSRNFKQALLFNISDKKDIIQGQLSKIDLEQFFIYGDSGTGSRWTDNNIVLVNGRNNSWANLTLTLKMPIDLTNNYLTFKAKGLKGQEKLVLTFTDKYLRPNPKEENVIPFPDGLATQWQQVKISLKKTSFNFDPTAITKMRFEFGSQKVENQPGAIIYLTGLGITEKYPEGK